MLTRLYESGPNFLQTNGRLLNFGGLENRLEDEGKTAVGKPKNRTCNGFVRKTVCGVILHCV